jgi:hypothetical protein
MEERTRLKLEIASRNHAALMVQGPEHDTWPSTDNRSTKEAIEYAACSWLHAEALLKLADSEAVSELASAVQHIADMTEMAKLQNEIKDLRERIITTRENSDFWRTSFEVSERAREALCNEVNVRQGAIDDLESVVAALTEERDQLKVHAIRFYSDTKALHEERDAIQRQSNEFHKQRDDAIEELRVQRERNDKLYYDLLQAGKEKPNLLPVCNHGDLFAVMTANSKVTERPVLTSNRLIAHEMAEALQVPVYRVRLEEMTDD